MRRHASPPEQPENANSGYRSILETGILKRSHGESTQALPWWWRQAGLRTLGSLLNAASHSLQNSAWLITVRLSFPLPLRVSAGVSPASRLTKPYGFAPALFYFTSSLLLLANVPNPGSESV
jgi:hypothetical protein